MGLPDDYRAMARIRRFEERLAALKDDGEIPGSIHLCNGQEAIPVGAARALRDGDHVTATYRGHGWALTRGVDMTGLFAEMMGRDSAVNGGRAASPYLSDPGRWFMGENSIVGAGVPIATGAALTAQRTGSGAVSVVSIGDGAMNQGNVHEAINLAAVLDLPLVLVVENNVYSEMSRIEDMVRIRQLAERAAGYGIPGRVVDGNDPDAVAQAVTEAVTRAREGTGPSIVEAMTERLVGHYSGDVQHYRPAGEIAAAREREPLVRIRAAADAELTARLDAIDAEVAAEVEAAVAAAREVPFPDPATVKEYVYV
ncbi:thiamine pyrophosphate-dependent dehydrogenase E1 component subunit alpha [Micromonospora craniellae]|uniref:Thiamine pyrophosphate-dependent dehydrogenase E1 component subunit alpha n=1 Tax=Micromonospora craniellae TaxID=2294034 RepID=A0A372G4B5_9ACTN|nr:thiamine pyrophosphate-dependent dehydrogenase E1 component subunit alpha [Micromonospora craniellae]QOC92090.1 thiamine pyrophosphate-dependent dehydrogenase E1 component subunit alpha [Micromonospora craniellae]RFS47580.1 thiamine pyrophosphate-dependent dehydrogenase E1 component subunit alpha [Micromonospora craniellae]